jgi:multicomponent K+:H+ antiporter subunit A
MAGVPLFNGFLSKEMFFAETVFVSGHPITRIGLPTMAVVWGILSVAYSLRFILQVFFGPPAEDLPKKPHEPPRWMLFPSALLVTACLVVGMFPDRTVGSYLNMASRSVLGENTPFHSLAVWHGFNLPLMMSLAAMVGGILLYRALGEYQQGTTVVPLIERFDGKRIFEFMLEKLDRLAMRLLRWFSTEHLQVQMLLLIIAVFASALIPLSSGGLPEGDKTPLPIEPAFAVLWLIGAVCAIAAAAQAKYHRLAALTLSGVAGLATCMTFVWFSAPDLALTQLIVEVVTLVLLLLGLRWLPPRDKSLDHETVPLPVRMRAEARRSRDLVIAICAGIGITGLSYAILTRSAGEGISPFFIENSLPLAGGSNVINVILVDFRGFDTMGEITVLGIVALTVFALLRRFRPAAEAMTVPVKQQEQDAQSGALPSDPHALLPAGPMMVPAVFVQLLLPVSGMVAIYFLLRGHNEPGGGFVAGLIVTTAVILQYLVGGTAWAESRTRIFPQYWLAAGLLCAAGAGMSAWLAARPFLSALAWHGTLPIIGEMHLSTVLLFDLGVFSLVIGAAVLILVALDHQSRRAHR